MVQCGMGRMRLPPAGRSDGARQAFSLKSRLPRQTGARRPLRATNRKPGVRVDPSEHREEDAAIFRKASSAAIVLQTSSRVAVLSLLPMMAQAHTLLAILCDAYAK